MYGTVDYFSDYLTFNVMNRLVNEHANSLENCHQQLLEEILSSQESKEVRVTYVKNLEKAYTLVLDHLMGVKE